jgi:hypothetical protein
MNFPPTRRPQSLPSIVSTLVLLFSAESTPADALEACAAPPVVKASELRRLPDDDPRSQELLRLSGPGENGGGLCKGIVYEVREPLTVHRLSHPTADKTPDYFNWWSFDEPSVSAKQYRKDNVMCSGWGVAWKTSCTLTVGTLVAVGAGNGLTCGPEEILPASPVAQIYVAGKNAAEIQKQTDGACRATASLLPP